MKSKLRVKGMDIAVPGYDELEAVLGRYLSSDSFNIIFLISGQMLDRAQEDDAYREALSRADLLLAEEESVFGGLMTDGRERVSSYRWILRALPKLRESKRGLYLLGTDERLMKAFMSCCEEAGLMDQMLGGYCINPELGPDIIINEINAVNPDIILGLMESPMQETWIVENRTKMNARLYLNIGNINDRLVSELKTVPKWIRSLHLEKAYRHLKRRK